MLFAFVHPAKLTSLNASSAARHGLRVQPEVLTYISIAARVRFRNLIESMISASRHRTWSSHLRPPPMYEDEEGRSTNVPMYDEELHDDPEKLIAALAKVEKAEEAKAKEKRWAREEKEVAKVEGEEGDRQDGKEGSVAPGGLAGSEGGGAGAAVDEENVRRKGKKVGVAAAAKNMTEDKRLKLANKTAAQALGFGNTGKAWMFGNAGGA